MGRWMWTWVTKGAVVYVTKRAGMRPAKATGSAVSYHDEEGFTMR